MDTRNLLDPITPGEILKEDFLEPLKISINQLARNIGVPPNRISEIVNGKRMVTADTALRLQRFFGVDAQFWLNLQLEYDLRLAKRQRWTDIEKQITPIQPALKIIPEIRNQSKKRSLFRRQGFREGQSPVQPLLIIPGGRPVLALGIITHPFMAFPVMSKGKARPESISCCARSGEPRRIIRLSL